MSVEFTQVTHYVIGVFWWNFDSMIKQYEFLEGFKAL